MIPKRTYEKRARALDTGGFLFDEELTRAALALASPEITTETQAAELFRAAAKGRQTRTEATALDDEAPTFDTDDWQQAQEWLVRWLPRIARAHELADSSAAVLARDLSRAISGVEIGEPRVSRRAGRYELTMYAHHDSIWAASIRAVLAFLPEYGWTRRLGQCELRECGKWFLRDFKTGPRQLYCSEEHAGLARIRRYRGKHA